MATDSDGRVVLVVEDDPFVTKVVRRVLERFGWRVLQANDGREALASQAKHREQIDLVVADLELAGSMTGADVARELVNRRPGLRCMFLSGWPGDRLAAYGMTGRGHALVEKPFSVDGFRKALDAVMQE